MALVAGVSVLMVELSSRRSPNELFPVMSFHAISAVAKLPRVNTPNPLSLIPLWYISVTAVLLMAPAAAEPQSVVVGVLALVPNEVVVTPHVLSWMSLYRSVAVTNEIRLLPGALITPMPLSWMWLPLRTTEVTAVVGALAPPDGDRGVRRRQPPPLLAPRALPPAARPARPG